MNYIPPKHHHLIPEYEKEIANTNGRTAAFIGITAAILSIPYLFFVFPIETTQDQIVFLSTLTSIIIFLLWPLPLHPRFHHNTTQSFLSLTLIATVFLTLFSSLNETGFAQLFNVYIIFIGISYLLLWTTRWHRINQAVLVVCALLSPIIIGIPYTLQVIGYLITIVAISLISIFFQPFILRFRWQQFYNRYRIQELNEQLTTRTAELDAFARTVAHDLKNPLGGIIGYSGYLTEILADFDIPNQEERDEITLIINRNEMLAQQGVSIINALLLLAATRKGEVETQQLDTPEILTRVRERLQHQIELKHAVITQAESWPTAAGHPPWIEEIWVNYITNALKYGGSPPHITLGCDTTAAGEARFWVQDNGAGLSPEEQEKLFIEFSRLHHDHTNNSHGLGLSIVRRIVHRLDGTAGVESEVGQGSKFYFTLPPH